MTAAKRTITRRKSQALLYREASSLDTSTLTSRPETQSTVSTQTVQDGGQGQLIPEEILRRLRRLANFTANPPTLEEVSAELSKRNDIGRIAYLIQPFFFS